MRSLAFAMLEHQGGNPAKGNDEADVPFRDNLKKAAKVREGWQQGKLTPTASADLLAALRTADAAEAADQVVALLNKSVDPASVWDGLFLAAGELLMRQPGIVGIHCVTSANALRFAFEASGDDETRRLLMLQAAAFLSLFRKAMAGRGKLADVQLDKLEPVNLEGKESEGVEEVFAAVAKDPLVAAKKALSLLDVKGLKAEEMMAAARRLVFAKGNDAHDYKFSSAALEDYYHATPAWRDRFLASSLFNLRGSGHKDNELIGRARAALAKG
jgi:hypothetical protein